MTLCNNIGGFRKSLSLLYHVITLRVQCPLSIGVLPNDILGFDAQYSIDTSPHDLNFPGNNISTEEDH